ncbi:MAG: hypothetical protein IKT50_02910 [Clostridia bacterium]|nr:hypothetical protein [Clostridia bacterium]
MLYPIIDIGSNTVKLAVLDAEKLFTQAPVFFKAAPLGLKTKTQDNRLKDSATNELCELITTYAETAARLTKVPPIVFATASLRGLENADEVLNKIRERCKVNATLIDGETEAYFSFLGARGSCPVKGGVSVDLGGGSTEILSFRKEKVIQSVSLPFGCLTLYQMFFSNGKSDYGGCCAFIREQLQKLAPKMAGNSVLISGGSAKAVLKYKNFLENKKNFTLGTKQMRRVKNHFENGKTEEKLKIESVLKDRFRLIPPAVAVFSQIAHFYEKDQVFVCRSGVREGCLFYTLQKEENKEVQFSKKA